MPVGTVLLIAFFDYMFWVDKPLCVWYLLLLLPFVTFVFGGLSLYQIYKSAGLLKGSELVLVAGAAVALPFIMLICSPRSGCILTYTFLCNNNLYSLKKSLIVYSHDNDGRYPTADKWCDLLKDQDYVTEDHLICPARKRTHPNERCSYAINPSAEPNSPPDVVLLFETKGGWNQFGGPEILSTANHPYERDEFWGYKVRGCNILFNDGRTEFVREKKFKNLKWK